MNSWQKTFMAVGNGVVNTVLPPRCFSCGVLVADQGDMCPTCWTGLCFISKPQCQCCGYPFEFSQEDDDGTGQLCGPCMEVPPLFENSRSVFRYDDTSKRLILAFKYFDKLDGVSSFAKLMWRTIEPFTSDDDIIVPVPLHPRRLFTRRFNQAALLAKAMAKHSELEVDMLSLARTKSTPIQGGLSRRQRTKNVRGAFAIEDGGKNKLKGKRVVLVDDVFTTGATVNECVKVLLRAKVTSVVVISLARVVNKL